ncbi:hypothetical protein AT270_30405 [Bacillus cereus]|nr:hypothetical protein AT270_30405 [Bacillus cereus]
MVFSKIQPVPFGTFNLIYKSEKSQVKKVSKNKGLYDIRCKKNSHLCVFAPKKWKILKDVNSKFDI